MADHVSVDEALGAMSAMLIVLTFFLVYFCCIPAYKSYHRRKEMEEELINTDQRWNTNRFDDQQQWPKNHKQDKKYSRLAACSRTSR
jgi:hypothetical protein